MNKPKHSSPISLFSFQDIVTSLTGIMIVIVLVILLELVESTARLAIRSKLHPERQELQNTLQQLKVRQNQLEQQLASSSEEFHKYSEEELRVLILQEQKKIRQLELQELQTAEKLQEQQRQLLEVQAKLNRQKQEENRLSNKEAKLLELQTQVTALQKQRADLEQSIKSKQNAVRIEFAGFSDKTPILVECSIRGFRACQLPEREIINFQDDNFSVLPSLEKLLEWLKMQDNDKVYPVFLFKPDAAGYVALLTGKLDQLTPKIEYGSEPLAQDEECF